MAKRRSPNPLDRSMGPWTQLALCVVLDIVGAMTYLLPGLGELADLIWAPIQGLVAYSLFIGEDWGLAWIAVSVGEELLPFTDIFPSLTVGWILKEVL